MAHVQSGDSNLSGERRLPGLLADLVRDSARLGVQEIALLRAEVGERTDKLVGGLIMLGAAAVFAIIALSLVVEAVVTWLTVVLQSEMAAVLICAGSAGLLAVILYAIGRGRLEPARLVPTRSAQSIKDDVAIVTRRV